MINVSRIVSALALLSILFSGCSGTNIISSPQTDQSPEVDGSISGWNLQESLIERSEAVNYYAMHDNEFLYLFVDVKSLAQNQAMRQSGFIIYISNSEENRKRTGIAFPSGTFNLLRENPSTYQSLLNDQEWLQNPQNQETLESLESQIFNRIMIVEQSGSSTNHGFVDKNQLQVDGIEISTGDNQRLMTLEMRVPLNSSSIYSLQRDQLWVGFEINPPDFRIQNDNNNSQNQQQYGRGRGMSQSSETRRVNLRQRMGQYEKWYLLSLD